MARSMDTEFNEESNKALFSAFDTDKVELQYESCEYACEDK